MYNSTEAWQTCPATQAVLVVDALAQITVTSPSNSMIAVACAPAVAT